MRVGDIAQFIESWAPPWIAWERDNVGLQVGNPERVVRKILVTLDVTEKTIEEAERRRVQLIVSHHPLLFRAPRAIVESDSVGRLVLLLAEKKIALYSAHTNLDFVKQGVSFALAHSLGLTNVRFLAPLNGLLAKVVVFVPSGHTESVRKAMVEAGAGVIGEYSDCSYEIIGRGSFRGSNRSRPTIGRKEHLEFAEEVRLEMVAPRARAQSIIAAVKAVHPYEEVACDVYPIENESSNYGAGAVGSLKVPVALSTFLSRLKEKLHAQRVRVVGNKDQIVHTVAVCGGSGSEFLPNALRAKADVFVTADVRYHTFHEADGQIALVDAGHWETEHVILPVLQRKLLEAGKLAKQKLEIFIAQSDTNVVQSY
jgi:dinuclear metal center YbgI/SA1388 family protein